MKTIKLAALTIAVALLASGCASTTAATPGSAPSATQLKSIELPTGTTWTSYHSDQARTSAVSGGGFGPVGKKWSTKLGAAVFGQPVVADDRIIAATEKNRVVALKPSNGKILWSKTIGKPLTHVDSVAGCGNIDPLGITSTPAIDSSSGVVYVVGEINDGHGVVHHQLVGLNLLTGKTVLSENVDPPLPSGERAVHLLQRASLAIANGRVYVSYGGNSGDCGSYHGWVVGVSETGAPDLVSFEVAADGEGGAIWESGGAPAIAANGDLFVTTGNANPDPPQGGPDPKAYTESVVTLSPDLKPLASFKDKIAGGDEDLATGNPMLLPDGTVFAIGKTNVAYLLSQSALASQASIRGVCGSNPDGGPAYDKSTNRIFVGCRGGGIQEIDLSTGTLGPRLSGANGAPIIVGRTLWALQYPQGTLSSYRIATGALLQKISIKTTLPHFATPSAALGMIMVGTNSGVVAFGRTHG